MVRRNRPHARRVAVAASIAVAAGFLAQPGPSGADVTAVSGSAYGYSLTATIGNVAPTPTVALPAGGSATALTNTAATGSAPPVFGSGLINVSTQGTPASGSVTSSASIANVTGTFAATGVASTCTASETGVSGSTTITGGTVETDNGDNADNSIPNHDPVTQPVPTGPTVSQVIDGHLHINGATDSFQYIFNEQIVTANSITVNAVHLKLLGPFVTGDLIIGQSVCGITATNGTTTTTQGNAGTTTTTQGNAGTTTTTQGNAGTTSTTQGTGGTTSTTQGTGITTSTTLNTPSPTPTTLFGSINVSALIRQIVCPILQQLAADPFLRPFIQPFLAGFGCTA